MSLYTEVRSHLSEADANVLLRSGEWHLLGTIASTDKVEYVVGHRTPATEKESHLWSRHYDTLQWTVCGILLGSSGALLIYFLDQKNAAHAKLMGVIGAMLVLISVCVVFGFRALRKQVHAAISSQDHVMFVNRNWPTLNHLNISVHILFWSLWMFQLGMLFVPMDTPWMCMTSALNVSAVCFCGLQH